MFTREYKRLLRRKSTILKKLSEVQAQIDILDADKDKPDPLNAQEPIKIKRGKSPARLFVDSKEWKQLREKARHLLPPVCVRCESVYDLQVDHIFPKSKYPDLALKLSNLQILCRKCNFAKSNKVDDYTFKRFPQINTCLLD